jgi:hypothetical protein
VTTTWVIDGYMMIVVISGVKKVEVCRGKKDYEQGVTIHHT